MRSVVLSNRVRLLSQVAVIGILSGLASGCSSDFSRFDRNLYSALPQSKYSNNSNPYPDDVDPTTTASINNGLPTPIADVNSQGVSPDHGGYNPTNNQTNYNQSQSSYQSAESSRSGVVKSNLPAPKSRVDPVQTSAVNNSQGLKPASNVANQSYPDDVGGWSKTGGTTLKLREGETLYNLSKRYGVPVKEIMRANNISNANNIKAGQRIVIPTYVYSQSAPISAPDNNAKTRAASSSSGLIKEQTANLSGSDIETDPALKKRYKPKTNAKDYNAEENVPDYSIVTSSIETSSGDKYVVVSGDSLSKIAQRSGTTVSALQKVNGISGTNIRIGQKLIIPSANKQLAASTKLPEGVDPIVTGNVNDDKPKAYTKPKVDASSLTASTDAKAPERTGIEQFRWPVKGRVISSFGQKRRGKSNDGIDISVPEGTSVKAAENGVVIYSGNELEGFGNLILVRHAGGYVTAYAHNKSNSVSKGSNVKRGQVIAKSGRTGDVSVPMLHFEVRKDSKPVNPTKYLDG